MTTFIHSFIRFFNENRKTVTSVQYHASQKYTTFTTIRFITFTVFKFSDHG